MLALFILELHPIFPAVTPLALLALWRAFPAVTPQHSYDTTPTNGKAPHAPLAIAGCSACKQSFISCILNSPKLKKYESNKYEKITDS